MGPSFPVCPQDATSFTPSAPPGPLHMLGAPCPSLTQPQPGRRPHTGGQVRNELPLLPSHGGRRGPRRRGREQGRVPEHSRGSSAASADLPRLLRCADVGVPDHLLVESGCFPQLQIRTNQGKSRGVRGASALSRAALGSANLTQVGKREKEWII